MLRLPPTQPQPCSVGLHPVQDLSKKTKRTGRSSVRGGPMAQSPFCPCVPSSWDVCHLWSPSMALWGVWPGHGVAGLACAAVCRGDGGHCGPGMGRGVTLLAAWAAPACAGTARGEGRTEEFAIWASLLLSCCYGTAEMLPGRRRWPVFVTPGLPPGREKSRVYKALLLYTTSPGENGFLTTKYCNRWVCRVYLCSL